MVDEFAIWLKNKDITIRNFDRRNIYRMREFFTSWCCVIWSLDSVNISIVVSAKSQFPVMPTWLGAIPWTHHIVILSGANPYIGLLLCKTKNDTVVEYSLSRNISPALVAEVPFFSQCFCCRFGFIRSVDNVWILEKLGFIRQTDELFQFEVTFKDIFRFFLDGFYFGITYFGRILSKIDIFELNQVVKRNGVRFSKLFRYQLTVVEKDLDNGNVDVSFYRLYPITTALRPQLNRM